LQLKLILPTAVWLASRTRCRFATRVLLTHCKTISRFCNRAWSRMMPRSGFDFDSRFSRTVTSRSSSSSGRAAFSSLSSSRTSVDLDQHELRETPFSLRPCDASRLQIPGSPSIKDDHNETEIYRSDACGSLVAKSGGLFFSFRPGLHRMIARPSSERA